MSRTTNYINFPAYVRPLIYFEDLKPKIIRRLMTETDPNATVESFIGKRISPQNREMADILARLKRHRPHRKRIC